MGTGHRPDIVRIRADYDRAEAEAVIYRGWKITRHRHREWRQRPKCRDISCGRAISRDRWYVSGVNPITSAYGPFCSDDHAKRFVDSSNQQRLVLQQAGFMRRSTRP